MIDERAVLTAKFWEALRSRRAPSSLREGEFEQFALMVLGLVCSAELPGLRLNRPMQEALGAMSTVEAQRDKDIFRDNWLRALDALVEELRIYDRTDGSPEIGSFDEFRSIVGLLDSLQKPWSSRQDFLLSCFDEVFHRVVSRLTAIGYRSGDSAAALAAHLSAPFLDSSEYFTTTGEFAVLRRSILAVATSARIGVLARLNLFVCLRLYLHDIKVSDRPREENLSSFVARRFLLIDHPHRKTSGQRPHSDKRTDHPTSLNALNYLLQELPILGAGLIVVPGADRSASGWRKELRRHLVRTGQLLAVIDLPLARGDKSRKEISAWLLSEESFNRDEVLMLDTKGLVGIGELRDVDSLMAFVAAIASFRRREGWPASAFVRHGRPTSEDAEAMLKAYFKDGYRDLEGICRRVHIDELAANGYTLAASTYLKKTQKRRGPMPLLNCEPVMEILLGRHEPSSRVYVIGNNGEGKSILLGDLAERLVQQDRRVVGISFGLTDRFAFKPPKSEGQSYVYVGARTSELGISLGRTSAQIDWMVREVHISAKRLGIFSAVVRQLGFGERRYLVPVDLKNSFDERDRYADLKQLTENADENLQIFHYADPNKYVLGLMRQESQNSITTFGELSSGEQQLLTLALKLTTYGARDTVILLDEPELSLHVSWQRAIPAMLEIVSSGLGCSIVVATHSPVIIASATHRDDQCFVARQHALTELSPRQRKSVETALFDGFRTYTANNRQVHERCAAMVSLAIQRLNTQSPVQMAELPTVQSLYEEVELMDQIIRRADSACLSHTREDLELVARTRAALDELVAIQRESTL
jgi:hypothetical protein